MTEVTSKQFDWNDNLAEIALEDFASIQQKLSYGTATTIGMALAKLEFLEKQGCKVEPPEHTEPKAYCCPVCGTRMQEVEDGCI